MSVQIVLARRAHADVDAGRRMADDLAAGLDVGRRGIAVELRVAGHAPGAVRAGGGARLHEADVVPAVAVRGRFVHVLGVVLGPDRVGHGLVVPDVRGPRAASHVPVVRAAVHRVAVGALEAVRGHRSRRRARVAGRHVGRPQGVAVALLISVDVVVPVAGHGVERAGQAPIRRRIRGGTDHVGNIRPALVARETGPVDRRGLQQR